MSERRAKIIALSCLVAGMLLVWQVLNGAGFGAVIFASAMLITAAFMTTRGDAS